MAVVLNIGILLFLTASLLVWKAIVQRWRLGEPAVELEPHSPVPWGPFEILLTICAFMLIAQAVFSLSGNPSSANPPQGTAETASNPAKVLQANTATDGTRQLLQQLVIEVATLAVSLAFIKLACRATWSDLGWQRGHLAKDVRLGVLGFLAAAPPTFFLQGVLTKWFPYHHMVTDALGREPPPGLFLLALGMVVLVAPMVEEFLFRVLLQGWFERLDEERRTKAPSLTLSPPRDWPIIVSSALFGLLHLGQGPAPVPLFVLALAMGYLYRQTHRQTPSLVLHGCFNATNMLLILLNPPSPAG